MLFNFGSLEATAKTENIFWTYKTWPLKSRAAAKYFQRFLEIRMFWADYSKTNYFISLMGQ